MFHIKLVVSNCLKSTLSKIKTFLKSYINVFNNEKSIILLSFKVVPPKIFINNEKKFIKQRY